MTTALAAPSPLRHGEVALLPLDATAPALLVAASYDHEVTRWTQVPEGMTLLDAGLVTAGWASNPNVVRFQVCLPDDSRVGMVTVWINNLGEAEVGYWLLEGARGRGVARRAVRMLCDWALATCDLERLHLTTLPGNTSSERVATACGFARCRQRTKDPSCEQHASEPDQADQQPRPRADQPTQAAPGPATAFSFFFLGVGLLSPHLPLPRQRHLQRRRLNHGGIGRKQTVGLIVGPPIFPPC